MFGFEAWPLFLYILPVIAVLPDYVVILMKTKVHSHEGVNIYRVDVRGETFYKTDPIFGEPQVAKTVDDAVKKIIAKKARGDTREKVQVHEGVNIYRVRDSGKTYFISDPVNDEVMVGDTIYDVALGITRMHAIFLR